MPGTHGCVALRSPDGASHQSPFFVLQGAEHAADGGLSRGIGEKSKQAWAFVRRILSHSRCPDDGFGDTRPDEGVCVAARTRR